MYAKKVVDIFIKVTKEQYINSRLQKTGEDTRKVWGVIKDDRINRKKQSGNKTKNLNYNGKMAVTVK